jgi:chondroitin-sulfate-ABC endolyase/exolyase
MFGGVEGERGEGVFAMKLHDTCHDPSFRAIKSYFIFGNQIICLGSNIENADTRHGTETTLFQCYMPNEGMAMELDGHPVTDFPLEHRSGGGALTVIDPYGNAYVVPAGQKVHVMRHRQTSRTANNEGPTEGDYSTGWIEHGAAPDEGGYEYAMLVQTTSDLVAGFAAHPPYRVLQKDEHAHILEHARRDVMACAIFTPDRELALGLIARTDTPTVAMIRRKGDGQIILRVADPKLRLPQRGNMAFLTEEDVEAERERHTLRLHLRGQWEAVQSDPSLSLHKYNDERMVLAADCADGRTLEMTLRRTGGD